MTETKLTRDELIAALLWFKGTDGEGAMPLTSMLMNAGRRQREVKLALALGGDPAIYTDEELEFLLQLAQDATVDHKRVCGAVLATDNFFRVTKIVYEGKITWRRKRPTWYMGPMESETLEDLRKVVVRKVGDKH